MPPSLNTFNMNNVLAAFIMLTRLPFWKIKEVPAECFKHVVPYWPLVGWLTGGVMAAVLWLAGQIMPVSLAWILALIARLLVTGCLHEDGLADFLDGFGGGTTRERTLAIMKDSHIGNRAGIIDNNALGATVDSVDNIIHAGSQIVNIFTVEGSDECRT